MGSWALWVCDAIAYQPTPPGPARRAGDAAWVTPYRRQMDVSRRSDNGPRPAALAGTVPAVFADAAGRAGPKPLLTWYDDATGERVELSGDTLGNWVAKTANLLVDGCGLGTGDTAAVDLPPHWLSAAVLLGCWSAGLVVSRPGGPGTDVVFAAGDRVAAPAGGPGYVFGLSFAPLAAPMREVPPGVADFVVEVRGHGDRFTPYAPIQGQDPATELSHAQLCRAAAGRADALGIRPGDRVLVAAAAHPEPLDWLLAPLVAGASVVLCGNLDPARLPDRVATERITVTLSPPLRDA